MRKLSFENPEMLDILTHQVIHMDQGISYAPEYIATREMKHYPSRTAQIIRAVHKGELPASQYGADMVFAPILSGQGERWQNFGEDPNGYILTVMLGRELFYQKGFYKEEIAALKEAAAVAVIRTHDEEKVDAWAQALPLNESSHTGLLLDEETFSCAAGSRERVGTFLKKRGIEIEAFGPYFTGFDLLAGGCIDEGTAVIKELLAGWKAKGITRMITLTGQSQYIFTVLLRWLGLETDIEFLSILDLAQGFDTENAYLYGGSFFTRYLRKDAALNALLANTEEEPLPSAPEFLPEVDGDKRRNVVGIWTPPLCAEYHTLAQITAGEETAAQNASAGQQDEKPAGIAGQRALEEQIYADSIALIGETAFGRLLVCDPFAWQALLHHGYPEKKMDYYLDVIR